MFVYWLLFLLPAVMAIVQPSRGLANYRFSPWINSRNGLPTMWSVVAVLMVVVIGFRYEVGADWENYFSQYQIASNLSIREALLLADPAYQLISMASAKADTGIVGVNFIAAIVFVFGLTCFCHSCSRPWLALTISVPYLVIVVGMGYTRQSVAIGLMMLGITQLERGKIVSYLGVSAVGAAFHRSAVVPILAGLFAYGRRRLASRVLIALVLLLLFRYLVLEYLPYVVSTYIDNAYESQGAVIRLVMCAAPGAVFIVKYKQFGFTPQATKLWLWASVLSIGLLVLVLMVESTTFLDRMALYLLPLQLVIFSRLPDVLGKTGRPNDAVVLAVISVYAAVLYIWLSYAEHARLWLPYRWAI